MPENCDEMSIEMKINDLQLHKNQILKLEKLDPANVFLKDDLHN